MNKNKKIRIIAISGSLRKNSYTAMALKYALDGAIKAGAETELIRLNELDLVFCDGSGKESEKYPDVKKLKQAVCDANGIILGTPEYHGSLSGILKNALDLMGFKEFEGKMIGLIGVSAGKMGGINALTTLRNIGRVLHAWVVPQQVAIPVVQDIFEKNGTIIDAVYKKRLNDLGKQVARFAMLHEAEKRGKFLKMWEIAPDNPGA